MKNVFLNIKNIFIGTLHIPEYIFQLWELQRQMEYSLKWCETKCNAVETQYFKKNEQLWPVGHLLGG